MNKKLLAIAVGAAIAMPGTVLAAGPTVYGKVNVSLEHQSEDPAPGAPENDDKWALDSNASRIGVKGDFDLDFGGLKALYQAEYEISVDGDDDPFKQRNIFAGLKGGFGTLKAGKFDTPTKVAQGDVDQFNDIDGDIKNIMAGEIRANNIIQYTTPKLADMVTLNVALIPNQDSDDFDGDGENENGLADSTSISVVLETGGLYAALSRDTDIVDSLEVDTGTLGTNVTLDITRVAVAYNLSGLELGALYQMAEETEDDGKDTSMLVSVAYGINQVKLKAQYGMTEADNTDEEATLMAIGADYKLGKNSKAFAYLSQVEFDVADTEERTIGLGVEHKF